MSVDVPQFWQLAVASQLIPAAEAEKLQDRYRQVAKDPSRGNARTLAEWLVAEKVLTRYQRKVLLAGQPGPFLFGPYKIYDRVMEGRLHGLFRAVHMPTRHAVLLKFLSGGALKHIGPLKQLAGTLGAVQQASLCGCDDLAEVGQFKFFVLPDLRGQSLRERLVEGGPLEIGDACRVARQVALALDRLQAAGFVHGDVRPENIWLDKTGQAALLGFPLGREPLAWLGLETWRPPDEYVAPEWQGQTYRPDTASDVFALGCTLYEMLGGTPPTPGGPTIPHGLPPQVPAALAAVVAYMTNRDRNGRYQQWGPVVQALAGFATPLPEIEGASPTSAAFEAWLKQQGNSGRKAPTAGPIPVNPQAAGVPDGGTPVPPMTGPPVPQQMPQMPQQMPQMPQQMPSMAPPMPSVPSGFPPAGPVTGAAMPTMATAPHGGPVSVGAGGAAAVLVSPPTRPALDPAMEYRRRLGPSKKSNRDLFVVCGVVVVAALLGTYVLWPRDSTARPTAANSSNGSSASSSFEEDEVELPPGVEGGVGSLTSGSDREDPPAAVAVDSSDPGVQWVSPTAGAPLDLAYLPSGAQLIVSWRPAALLAHAEGEKILDTLGPLGTVARQHIEQRVGRPLEAIEQVLVGVYETSGGAQAFAIVAEVSEAIDPAAAWPGAQEVSDGKHTFLADEQFAYLTAQREPRQLVAIVPVAMVQDALRSAEGTAPRSPQLEQLLHVSDRDRLVNVLFTPAFLFKEGKGVFVGDAAHLRQPVFEFLGDHADGGLLSFHLDEENFFAELRLRGRLERPAPALGEDFKQRLADLQPRVRDYIEDPSFPLIPYNRAVLMRFPSMIELLAKYTRASIEERQVVLRSYLPAVAAHNLVLGTRLAVMRNLAAGPVASAGDPVPTEPKTLEEKLKKSITLSFEKNDLIDCLRLLGDEAGVQFRIRGPDLQLEGITQNQPITNLNEENKPAIDVLLKVLKMANPAGKLVYVVNEEEGQIEITTRAAAEKNKEPIPAVFNQ